MVVCGIKLFECGMERKKGLGEWGRDANSKAEDTWTVRRRKRGTERKSMRRRPNCLGWGPCCPSPGWEVSWDFTLLMTLLPPFLWTEWVNWACVELIRGFLDGSVVKNLPAMQETQETWVWSLGWEEIPALGGVPWRRKWQPTPVFLPGESHGQRSLAG